MRRRRPDPSRPSPPADGVPLALRAGPCLEIYGRDPFAAVKAWKAARDAWLAGHGMTLDQAPEPLRPRWRGAWSFQYLSADSERLAELLDRLGLPPDWRP